MLVGAGTASARGWYVGLEAGANWTADTPAVYSETAPPFVTLTDATFDTGWTLVATVGYAMQNWRIEAELAWRSNELDGLVVGGPSTGSLDALTAMYNMTYQLPLTQGLGLAIGGGAGIDYAVLDIPGIDDGDLNFAYQGIVQLNYTLSAATELIVGYRYMHVLSPDFAGSVGALHINADFDDFSKHALTLGVRYTFAP